MKTRIATLVMVSAFLMSAVAVAGVPPTTSCTSNCDPGYLGPPLELPKFLLKKATHMANYNLNDEPWEPKYAKKSLRPAKPVLD